MAIKKRSTPKFLRETYLTPSWVIVIEDERVMQFRELSAEPSKYSNLTTMASLIRSVADRKPTSVIAAGLLLATHHILKEEHDEELLSTNALYDLYTFMGNYSRIRSLDTKAAELWNKNSAVFSKYSVLKKPKPKPSKKTKRKRLDKHR